LLRNWAEAHGLEVRQEGDGFIAWPRSLFGLRAELEHIEGIVATLGTIRREGRVKVGALSGRLRQEVESAIAWAGPYTADRPASIDDADVTFSIHGWYELSKGSKSLWVAASAVNRASGFTPVRYPMLEPGATRKPVPAPPPRFDSVPAIVVDLAWPEGREPGIRDKVSFAGRAADQFAAAVEEASDAIRDGYLAFFAGIENSGKTIQLQALTGDMQTTSDLPGTVGKLLRDKLVEGFERHGFKTAAEAEAFFTGASVGRRRAKVSLEFETVSHLGKVGVSTEFSGPFTPRG
ncbi:MAG: hypothetical protein AB7T05_11805, partial [Fimbriimonadaceae bacterium]